MSPSLSSPAIQLSAILVEPLCHWEPERILAYYQSRSTVQYFPVADENEVRREKIDGILAGRFEFNGECYAFPAGVDWLENPSADIEWLILLHKFYYAAGLGMAYDETGDPRYAETWVDLTSSWIDAVPLGLLPSDVAGRRIQNWIFAHYYFVTKHQPACVTADFYARWIASLYEQVRHLREHLTPARNHRTLELWALFLAAVVFPELRGASEWLEFARRELLANMRADLLPDGVQCELSLDYHHIVLRNYLAARRLSLLNEIPMPAEMDELIRKALEFSLYAHTPAGTVPALSDGDRADFRYLLEEGHRLYGCGEMLYVASQGRRGTMPAQTSVAFPASGYAIMRGGWGRGGAYEDELYLIFDCGPLGAGNHGHLDLLSFEMAAYGRSLIVDPGRYTYDESGEPNLRALFRGTGYHNTVLVDGRNQTRYEQHKGKFKIRGPAPRHELKAFVTRESFDYAHGIARSHEYPVVHERKIFFVRPEYWVICDRLHAAEPHDYEVRFHLPAEAWGRAAVSRESGALRIDSPGLVLAHPCHPDVAAALEDGWVSPRYGVKHPAPIATLRRRASDAAFFTVVYPFRAHAPALAVEPLPSAPEEGIRMRIGDHTVDEIRFAEDGSVRFARSGATGAAIMRSAI